jgi:hypothetical protein
MHSDSLSMVLEDQASWVETFRNLAKKNHTLASIILRNGLPLVTKDGNRLTSTLVERTSSVMVTRLPLHLQSSEKRRLMFLVPKATQHLGQFLTVSLLLADFVHRFDPRIPSSEKGCLVNGDLLLITQHIRECISLLREVSIEDTKLTKFWPIEVLSQYSPPIDDKPRVFVANPGWLGTIDIQRQFHSVIIDASHPRTLEHLDNLLRYPNIESSSVQILVLPPCEPERIEHLRKDHQITHLTWAWDPAASKVLEGIFSPESQVSRQTEVKRFIWLCNDNMVGDPLAELHSLLVGALRVCGGRTPGRLLEAWSVYHRLRQLAVPLILLEEERRQSYKTLTINERIQILEQDPPNGFGAFSSYIDARWPRIIENLKKIYGILLEYKEPAKFYTLATGLEEQLRQLISFDGPQMLRVIAPTVQEGRILSILLSDLVEGWSEALQKGQVSITTVREEPRLIAEGESFISVLLGFRTSDTRYLDTYPGVPVHVVAYPYEAEVDEAIQRRVHASIEQFQDNALRMTTLKKLQLPVTMQVDRFNGNKEHWVPLSSRTQTIIQDQFGEKIQLKKRLISDEVVEPLDISKLAGLTWTDEIISEVPQKEVAVNYREYSKSIEFVEVVVSTGERIRYPAARLIDVYHPATEIKERVVAAELKSGMLIIVLVDDPYEDLFERLIETINAQRDSRASMALELWQSAKRAALIKADNNRQKLYKILAERGLSVDYAAVVGWYASGEDEIIAPLKEPDFEILANLSGIYTDFKLLEVTFRYIQKERALRRGYGKLLYRLLAKIAAGQNYEVALKSAKVLGTPLEQIAAAVSLKQVELVRRLGTIFDM